MFTTEEPQSIDRKYFTVLVVDCFDAALISNNTRHVWYIQKVELEDRSTCPVYHKYKFTSIIVVPAVEHFRRQSGISSPMMNFNKTAESQPGKSL